MAQVCGTCNRSWDDRATFCGACGTRLGATLAGPEDPPPTSRRRLPTGLLWSALAVAVVVGGVFAVPAVQVERSRSVPGDIGVPDADDLQAAGSTDTEQDDQARAETPRTIPPPNVSCTRDETPVGCVLWVRRMFDPGAQGEHGLPPQAQLADDLLAVENHTLRGFDTTTGRERWQRQFGRPVEAVHASDGVGLVHLGSRVHALSISDAEELWTAEALGPVHGPIVSDGLVYTARLDEEGPRLLARAIEDGSVAWESPAGDEARFNVVDSSERGVLIATYENELAFYDRGSGERRWQRDGSARMLVHDDVLVFVEPGADRGPEAPTGGGDSDATLRGIDLVTGDLRWERSLPVRETRFRIHGDLLLVSTSELLTALDVGTGRTRWGAEVTEQEHAASGPASPARQAPDDTIVTVGQDSGTLRARNAASGEPKWRYQPSSGEFGHAMVFEDVTLVATPTGLDVVDTARGTQQLRIGADADLHPVGAGPELLLDHRSGYAVRLDLSSPGALRGFP